MGCTEPVAIALAAAHAAKAIDEVSTIESITLMVSTNILKNALNVGVPRTKRVGLEISVAMGVFAKSDFGLSLLAELSECDVTQAHRFQQCVPITIVQYTGPERIYIGVKIKTTDQIHEAVLSRRHDLLTYYAVDDVVYYQDDSNSEIKKDYESLFSLKINDILKSVLEIEHSDLLFLMDGYHMNLQMAQYGLQNAPGLGLGFALAKEQLHQLEPKDLMNLAMQMTAAASDARMAGANLPVMTSNGSGNNGLTAVLPIVAASMIFKYSTEQIATALAMSHLVNSYIKHAIGRLSPICACGVASATGSAVGIGYLFGIPQDQLPFIVNTMIANLSGMACDGAKLGCSLKLSTATAAAIQSVYLLKHQSYADQRNGIVGVTPEDSVRNLGLLANRGMSSADQVMTEILLSKFN